LILHFAFPGFKWLDPGSSGEGALATVQGPNGAAGLPAAAKRTESPRRAAPIDPTLERETLSALGPSLADPPEELPQKLDLAGKPARSRQDVLHERAQATEEQARQFAAERERVVVTVYYTEWCPACRSARGYLQQRGIRFEEHDIERDSRARARQRLLNPKGSVPTLLIEDQVLIGFSASRIEKAIDHAARSRLERSQ
jgi:glutaredoxin